MSGCGCNILLLEGPACILLFSSFLIFICVVSSPRRRSFQTGCATFVSNIQKFFRFCNSRMKISVSQNDAHTSSGKENLHVSFVSVFLSILTLIEAKSFFFLHTSIWVTLYSLEFLVHNSRLFMF